VASCLTGSRRTQNYVAKKEEDKDEAAEAERRAEEKAGRVGIGIGPHLRCNQP